MNIIIYAYPVEATAVFVLKIVVLNVLIQKNILSL
jgi:hypothetical protein